MCFHLIQGDIIHMQVDAIVNAARTDLKCSAGICSAIFAAADTEALSKACNRIGYCAPGWAVVTKAYGLPARYIIHTAGPSWYGGRKNERFILASCYKHSLDMAVAYNCKSIAFPLIFSGDFHIPRKDAVLIAKKSIEKYIKYHPLEVYLVLYNPAIYEFAQKVISEDKPKKIWNRR